MQITINEAEIKEGCKRYVADQGIGVDGQEVDVQLIAGRGANGFTATVDLSTCAKTKTEKKAAKAPVEKESVTAGAEDPEVAMTEKEDAENQEEEGNLFGD